MWEIITSNSRLFWLLLVIVVTFLVRLITVVTFNFLLKKDKGRRSNNQSTLLLLKKISLTVIYILAVLFASYSLFEKEVYQTIGQNILIVFWITIVMIATVIGAALTQRYFTQKIKHSSKRDASDPTTYKFLSYFSTFAIYFVGICLAALAIPPLKSLAQSALAGAGVIAIIGGFASQEAMSNLIGGIFIVFFKPFRIGDCVRVDGETIGIVEDLTLRHTVIKDFHNKKIIIPNAIMNKERLTNYNMGIQKICEWIAVGISYDSDINKALSIMREEALQHPLCIDARTELQKLNDEPKVLTKVTDLGDSSVNLRAWVWANNYVDAVNMRHDLYKSIKERFDTEGIEIPYPHRTLVHRYKYEFAPQKGLQTSFASTTESETRPKIGPEMEAMMNNSFSSNGQKLAKT